MDEFLELDQDFDLDPISPEDVLVSLGLDNLSIERLLELLKKGNDEIKKKFESMELKKGLGEIDKYLGLGKKYAPVAYAIFDKLEPRICTFLAGNRRQATGCYPDTIIYWADPDAITGLYEALEKDGHYATKSIT